MSAKALKKITLIIGGAFRDIHGAIVIRVKV
jgi:hypothetical protein